MKDYGTQTSGEWGFRKPSDGWHLIQFQDGIDYLKNKEGEVWSDEKTGRKALKLPALVADEKDESNGLDCSVLVQVTEAGEKRMANILNATKLYKKFAEKFPGDIGMFDKDVLAAIKVKLPGQFMKVELATNKNGNQNFVYFGPADYVPEEKEEKVPDKDKGKSEGKKAPASGGEDW